MLHSYNTQTLTYKTENELLITQPE